jgi:glycine/D-amino acid oxidase-like deaminating enzyme
MSTRGSRRRAARRATGRCATASAPTIRAHFPLTPEARARPQLNPGNGTVSKLCHEPRAALAVIDELLRGVEVLREHRPTAAAVDGDRVQAVTVGDVTIEADWFIDATETGELLALCGVEHVTGAESRDDTGEPHAAERADPLNMQPISVCFAVDHLAGEDHTIARPAGYEQHTFSLTAPDPQTNRPVSRTLRPNPPGDPALIGPDFSNPTSTRISGCSAASPPAATSPRTRATSPS